MKRKIIDAFKSPLKEKNAAMDIIIGGLLLYFPVVQFISFGYIVKKLQYIIAMEKSTPKWDDNLKELFLLGAKACAILLVFMILPLLLTFLEGFFVSSLTQGKIWSIFFLKGQVIGLLKSVLFFLAFFFLPFSFCLLLETKILRSAFDIREILERILLIPREYLLIYIVIMALYLSSFILIILLMNWVAALLLAGFIFFYVGLVAANLVGKIFPRKMITIPLQQKNPS